MALRSVLCAVAALGLIGCSAFGGSPEDSLLVPPAQLPDGMVYAGCVKGHTGVDGIRVNVHAEGSRCTFSKEIIESISEIDMDDGTIRFKRLGSGE